MQKTAVFGGVNRVRISSQSLKRAIRMSEYYHDQFGPASIRTRELENALGVGIKQVEGNETETVVLQRRSMRLKTELPADSILAREHFDVLRPCPQDAIPPSRINDVLGRHLRHDMRPGDYLRWNDLK